MEEESRKLTVVDASSMHIDFVGNKFLNTHLDVWFNGYIILFIKDVLVIG